VSKIIEFQLKQEHIPLIQLLKFVGVASSGSDASMLVEENQVLCNGIIETRKRYKVKDGDVISTLKHEIRVKK